MTRMADPSLYRHLTEQGGTQTGGPGSSCDGERIQGAVRQLAVQVHDDVPKLRG